MPTGTTVIVLSPTHLRAIIHIPAVKSSRRIAAFFTNPLEYWEI